MVSFTGHLGGVQGGSVGTGEKSRAGGRHEHPVGRPRVRVGAQDNPKMLAYSVPPGYERKKPVKRPKLGPSYRQRIRSVWNL